jgi:hypothetical protein
MIRRPIPSNICVTGENTRAIAREQLCGQVVLSSTRAQAIMDIFCAVYAVAI